MKVFTILKNKLRRAYLFQVITLHHAAFFLSWFRKKKIVKSTSSFLLWHRYMISRKDLIIKFHCFPHCYLWFHEKIVKSTVWKNEKFSLTEKKFREINSLVFSLVKTALSRNFLPKSVRENFRNFHNVK